jgi:hypothetical protein
MVCGKKAAIVLTLTPIGGVRRDLEKLYARRAAIDALIESLQVYDRYRAKSADSRKRKTA